MSGVLNDIPTVSVDDVPLSDSPKLLQYDRDTMLKLYISPLSKMRPEYLSEEFDRIVPTENGNVEGTAKLWGPDLWIESIWKKESNSGNSGGGVNLRPHRGGGSSAGGQRSMNGNDNSRRKQGVDRLKSEHKDGIVLSPQRRSFGAGCQAPAAAASSTSSANTSSQNSSTGVGIIFNSQRRSVSPSRNVGNDYDSGSSQQQNLSRNSKTRQNIITASYSSDAGGRGGGGGRGGRVSADSGYQSRVVDRGSDGTSLGGFHAPPSSRVDRVENWRDRNQWSNEGRDYQQNRRGMNNGRYSYRPNDDLPEWATDGPSDMHETIELHGFDDEFEQNDDTNGAASIGKEKNFQNHRANSESSSSGDYHRRQSHRNDYSPRDKPMEQYKFSANAKTDAKVVDVTKLIASDVEPIYNGGGGGVSDKAHKDTPGTSRFSKFFGKGSSDKNNNNKAASEHSHDVDRERKLSASTSSQPTNSVMEFLSKAKINVVHQEKDSQIAPSVGKLPAGAMNLEDLEAILVQKKQENAQKMLPNVAKASAESSDLSGKQLLQDLFKTASSNQIQMMNNASVHVATEPRSDSAANAAAPSAKVTKMQIVKGNPLADPNQQQHLMEALQKLQVQQQSSSEPAVHHFTQQSQMSFVMPQTSALPPNPLLQAMLTGGGKMPTAVAPGAGDSILANMLHHHQSMNTGSAGLQQASSPQPSATAMSQQDLLVNAQMLYQKALLSRKLEEQKENFAKRQQQQADSMMGGACMMDAGPSATQSSVSKSPYSAFLPTSVLKQMHGVSGNTKPTQQQNFASAAKEAADLHKSAQISGLAFGVNQSESSASRPIVKQQMAQPISAGVNTSNVQPTNAAGAGNPHPQDVIRFMHQQQQAAQQMQLLRLQQLQMLQQLGGGLIQPRMVNTNKPMSNEEYQQILAMALLQQQQQQQQIRAAAAAAATSPPVPAGVDLMRQRAMMAAAAQQQMSSQHHQQQQQQQMMNSFRPQNYAQNNAASVNASQQNEANLRNLFNVGNLSSSSVVFPPMPVGGANAKPITLDEIERMQKQNTSTNINQ